MWGIQFWFGNFSGAIDDLRLLNHAASAEQIAQDAGGMKGKTGERALYKRQGGDMDPRRDDGQALQARSRLSRARLIS